jgi:hypothetical protein
MTQQELDLLKFPAGLMAQTGACAPKIVWSNRPVLEHPPPLEPQLRASLHINFG